MGFSEIGHIEDMRLHRERQTKRTGLEDLFIYGSHPNSSGSVEWMANIPGLDWAKLRSAIGECSASTTAELAASLPELRKQ